MQRAFDLIIERLEQQAKQYNRRALELVEKSADAGIHNKGKACSYEHAIEIVNQVASEYGGGWIPVSERLPDRIAPFQTSEYTVTMCFVKNGKKGRPFTSHASFDFESDKWLVKDHEVIAWRERIEPYKAESEE